MHAHDRRRCKRFALEIAKREANVGDDRVYESRGTSVAASLLMRRDVSKLASRGELRVSHAHSRLDECRGALIEVPLHLVLHLALER